jgi:septin family protein
MHTFPPHTKSYGYVWTVVELIENGVKLHMTVIDTPGFGDQLDKERGLQPIMDYINAQFSEYLNAERSDDFRESIGDTRVHTLLYFISPSGSFGYVWVFPYV